MNLNQMEQVESVNGLIANNHPHPIQRKRQNNGDCGKKVKKIQNN